MCVMRYDNDKRRKINGPYLQSLKIQEVAERNRMKEEWNDGGGVNGEAR